MSALLFGCANNPPAPIESRQGVVLDASRGAVKPELAHAPHYGGSLDHGKPYTVEEGDTLYAIAFRLGADYRLLARANDIAPPYLIYPGQTLSTIDPVAGSVAGQSAEVALSHPPVTAVVTEATVGSAGTATAKSTAEVTSKPEVKVAPQPQSKAKPPSTPKSSAQPKPASKTAATVTAESQVATPSKPVSKPPTAKANPVAQGNQQKLGPVTRWLWPGKGPVERAYSAVLHKGIDIAGQRGDPVYATAAGVVVYAGTGLKGYGALLIIKHNEQFLSAYGHNDVMLVAEGTNINAGQQIARMGSSGTDTVKLHFEIRRKGQPVDPLRLLPRR
ncbi:MAG: peptidoglycan DD-metalloendopeptidase family protein [Luminiphilus sp.]|nr:peptidoglycan DD-metalloendopeptidase family protein [Luminiphilus sp.]